MIFAVVTAALKCLSNLTFNCPVVQVFVSKSCCSAVILERAKSIADPNIPHIVKLFDLKLLFLITAKCPEVGYTIEKFSFEAFSNIIYFQKPYKK